MRYTNRRILYCERMLCCVSEGTDVVVRAGVKGRLGEHHVHGARRCRSRSAGERDRFSVTRAV